MDTAYYLDKFHKSLDLLDRRRFNDQQLELKVGVWLDSVVLKIQNKAWLGNGDAMKPFQGSVFFSIWVSDDTIREGRIWYNIHALKLRELAGHKIKSRNFATAFRSQFYQFEKEWPNVTTDHGPLTLMQGWVPLIDADIEQQVAELAGKFLHISPIIDDLIKETKK